MPGGHVEAVAALTVTGMPISNTCDFAGCRNLNSAHSPNGDRCWLEAHWGPRPTEARSRTGMNQLGRPPLPALTGSADRAPEQPWETAVRTGRFRFTPARNEPIARRLGLSQVSADLGGFRMGFHHQFGGRRVLYVVVPALADRGWIPVPIGGEATSAAGVTRECRTFASNGPAAVHALLEEHLVERRRADALFPGGSPRRLGGFGVAELESAAYLLDPNLSDAERRLARTYQPEWVGTLAELKATIAAITGDTGATA